MELYLEERDLYILFAAFLAMVEDNHAAQDGMNEDQWKRAAELLEQFQELVEIP